MAAGRRGTGSPLRPDEVETAARLLRRTRAFSRMPDAELEQLVREAVSKPPRGAESSILCLQPGDVLFEADTDADRIFVVLEGCLEERSAGGSTFLKDIDEGDVVGEIAVLAERPEDGDHFTRASQVRCPDDEDATPARVLQIDEKVVRDLVKKGGAFALELLHGVANDALLLLEERRTLDQVYQDYFDGPSSRLVPGPYKGEGVEMYIVFAKVPGPVPLLPPGLCQPNPGPFPGLIMLVFARFPQFVQPDYPDAKPFVYNETAFFVPCLMYSQKKPFVHLRFFVPALYPDNFMAILLGREIYGFPKRAARTYIPEDPRTRRLRLLLDGVQVARLDYGPKRVSLDTSSPKTFLKSLATNGATALAEPIRAWLNLVMRAMKRIPVAVLKQIPGPQMTRQRVDYEVNQLCLSPFRVHGFEKAELLTDVRLRLGGNIPYADAQLVCPFALHVVSDFDLETGEVLRVYPRDMEPMDRGRCR